MPFVIVSDGRADCRGAKVINPSTGAVLVFATRREARAHRDSILPEQPSKYLPLRVRELARDHEHCAAAGACWQDRYPCPAP